MKKSALALLAFGVLAASCGLRGDLQRPPPMWGSERVAREEAERERRAREAAARTSAEETPGLGSGGSSIPVPAR